MRIRSVAFPSSVAEKIGSRGITEEEIREALAADPDLGDLEPTLHPGGVGRRGGVVFRGLCRVPTSGRYLEVAFELMPDGTAWCYHALEMRPRDRRRFRRRG